MFNAQIPLNLYKTLVKKKINMIRTELIILSINMELFISIVLSPGILNF